ncbi:MAG: DUF5615 family PIN-like protein [Actinomycetota bacterium]|nr:hypothetical protein [Actinomycetota bacterium]
MRLLLDESVPHTLAASLTGHAVETAQSMGWAGVRNVELLQRGAEAGFDAFITVDKGFEFEQNTDMLPLTVAILRARSNRVENLMLLVPNLIAKLTESEPGSLIKISGRE